MVPEQADPTGIVFPLHSMSGPEAEHLADAAGSLADLRFSERAVSALLDMWAPDATEGPDGTIPRSLWIAAIVSYARSFKGGVRHSTADALIDGLGGGARDTHAYFLTLRDGHIAHSVNALEQTAVGVFLSDQPEAIPQGVGSVSVFRILEDRETTTDFQTFVRHLADAMTVRCEELQVAVLEAASRLTRDERSTLPTVRLAAPDPATLANRRPRSIR